MAKEREEAILRITARYVAELEAGRQPRLSDYLIRHPHYAAEIADFVAYYHAVEAHLPQDLTTPAPLSDVSRAALAKLQKPQPTPLPAKPFMTLLQTAQGQQLTTSQLAAHLDLSTDIITLLERRLVDPSTIPDELLRRLATTLHHSISEVRAFVASTEQAREAGPLDPSQLKVAEKRPQYNVQDSEIAQPFRRLLDQSSQLSPQQKAEWHSILADEGL